MKKTFFTIFTACVFISLLLSCARKSLPTAAVEPQPTGTTSITATFTTTPVVSPTEGPDIYEPDDWPGTAGFISPGQLQVHSLYPDTDFRDYIKFSVTEHSYVTVTITMDNSSINNNVILVVYDAWLNTCSNDIIAYSGSSTVYCVPGDYYIAVLPNMGTTIALYQISISLQQVSPTVTPTGTPTWTMTGTKTFTPTVTMTNTPQDTATVTETFTITETWTDSPTITPTHTISPTFTITMTPTITCVYSDMVAVPGGTFLQQNPTYCCEFFTHTVSHFRIGKYEVTADLWNTIRLWGIANGYNFTVAGSGSGYLPIIRVNWRNAVVWCNAYSESNGLNFVYFSDAGFSTPLKNAADAGAVDNAFVNWGSNGFRLPTEGEWVDAARYIDGSSWTPSTYSSGALNNGDAEIDAVSWTSNNSGLSPKNVGQLRPNALGIYDMSGNAYEIVWDGYSNYPTSAQVNYRGPTSGFTHRVMKGGAYYYYSDNVGGQYFSQPGDSSCTTCGFRVAQKY